MSKSHPEQWTIHQVAERPDRALVAALREFTTTQLADCGGPFSIVAPPLRPPQVTCWSSTAGAGRTQR